MNAFMASGAAVAKEVDAIKTPSDRERQRAMAISTNRIRNAHFTTADPVSPEKSANPNRRNARSKRKTRGAATVK
jgi:hypothetical protein